MVPVLFLCATIFSVPAFFGLLPLMVNFGELFNYRIKVLAAGLLTGSALALVIPEGVGGLFEAGDTKGKCRCLHVNWRFFKKESVVAASESR